MKLLDKILTGILSVLAAAFSLAMISVAIGWPISDSVLQKMVTGIQNPWTAVWVSVCALVVIAIAVRLVYALFRNDSKRPNKVAVLKSEAGESYMTISAVNTIVARIIKGNTSVKDFRSYVKTNGETVEINAIITAISGVQIPVLTEQLQDAIKNSVEEYTGVKVEHVEVVVSATENEPEKIKTARVS